MTIVTEWLSKVDSPLSCTNDKETVKPLSNSPEPVNVNWLPMCSLLPALLLHQIILSTLTDAPPATLIDPAYADSSNK